jgi:prolyl-tRNA editing enzyme YbaK/EbsC (Cys-tRNA(Pro) deacylase)
MSKSLKRVQRTALELGLTIDVVETQIDTHTAEQAAQSQGCHVDQIAKSIIFRGEDSGTAILFLTAGGNRVDATKASALANEPLGKADAALIRAQTGFAIGGVSPIGHLNPIKTFIDPRLMEFDLLWAAAGTPRHVFALAPQTLVDVTGAVVANFTD